MPMQKQSKYSGKSGGGSRLSGVDVAAIIQEHQMGASVADICQRHAISTSTFYKRKADVNGSRGLLRADPATGRPGNAVALGRPPRVTTQDIVRAALDVGLERATIGNVAKALGMSATGLYHHVRSREELIDFVAKFALAEILDKTDEIVDFEDKLLYFSRALFELYSDHPQTIITMLSGYIMFTPRMLPMYERVFESAVRSGLTAIEAYDIWDSVMAVVVGAAVNEAFERSVRKHSSFLKIMKTALPATNSELKYLVEVTNSRAHVRVDHFAKVLTMIDALRARLANGSSRRATRPAKQRRV